MVCWFLFAAKENPSRLRFSMLSNFAVTLSLRHYIMAEDYGGWSGGAPDLLLWPSAVLAAAAAAATAASVKAVKAVELGRRRLTALNSVLKASMV